MSKDSDEQTEYISPLNDPISLTFINYVEKRYKRRHHPTANNCKRKRYLSLISWPFPAEIRNKQNCSQSPWTIHLLEIQTSTTARAIYRQKLQSMLLKWRHKARTLPPSLILPATTSSEILRREGSWEGDRTRLRGSSGDYYERLGERQNIKGKKTRKRSLERILAQRLAASLAPPRSLFF